MDEDVGKCKLIWRENPEEKTRTAVGNVTIREDGFIVIDTANGKMWINKK